MYQQPTGPPPTSLECFSKGRGKAMAPTWALLAQVGSAGIFDFRTKAAKGLRLLCSSPKPAPSGNKTIQTLKNEALLHIIALIIHETARILLIAVYYFLDPADMPSLMRFAVNRPSTVQATRSAAFARSNSVPLGARLGDNAHQNDYCQTACVL